MSDQPKLSLCLNTHNEGADVAETIRSIRAAYDGPFEAVVVADGTTDGSCSDLGVFCKCGRMNEALLRSYPNNDTDHIDTWSCPKCGDVTRMIYNKKRVGCGQAKNQAIEAATGAVILHADAHCRMLRGDLNTMVRVAAELDAILAPGVAPLHCQPSEQPAADHRIKNCTWGGKIGMTPTGAKVLPAGKPRKDFGDRMATWWACFMFSKSVIKRLGGWNAYPGRWGSQEIGLALRAYFADVPIIAVRDVVIGHRYRDWSGGANYAPYKILRSERRANHRYAHAAVFDPETVETIWRPLWPASEHGERMLKKSKLTEQAEYFRTHCKRRTDREFFDAFGYPQGAQPLPPEAVPQTDTAPVAAPVPAPSALLPLDQITAIILCYKRPKKQQQVINGLVGMGLKHIWAWCNAPAVPPKGATRIFTDSQNGMTWPRYAMAPLAPTPWVLFCDDDTLLLPAGLDALRRGAVKYPGRNLALIGCRYKAPFTGGLRRRIYAKSHQIKEAQPVDAPWPKGQLIARDLLQRVFGQAELWQKMRAVVGSTSGDDLIASIIQRMMGEEPILVVPSDGPGYKDSRTDEAPRNARLSRMPGRMRRKKASVRLWQQLGWRSLEMPDNWQPPSDEVRAMCDKFGWHDLAGIPKDDVFDQRMRALAAMKSSHLQHPVEFRQAWDIVRAKQPKVFVEIGSHAGGSLYVYAGACAPGATIIAVDNGERGSKVRVGLRRVIQQLNAEGYKAQWLRGDSQAVALDNAIEFLHIDAGHKYREVKADYQKYAPLVVPGGIIALHDICCTSKRKPSVPKFWNRIKPKDAIEIYEGEYGDLGRSGVGIFTQTGGK